MTHNLNTWPEFFQCSWVGEKTFEIRKNDRNFKVCDEVILQEWDFADEEYTGREIRGTICYVTAFEQKRGWVVFGYKPTLFSE